jgi:hypothetical protein
LTIKKTVVKETLFQFGMIIDEIFPMISISPFVYLVIKEAWWLNNIEHVILEESMELLIHVTTKLCDTLLDKKVLIEIF